MKVEQVYSLLNDITKEVLGETIVVNEDLSNVVDIGVAFENLKDGYDNYVKSLYNHIGKVIFVDRKYGGRGLNVLRDAWEYGSILEKIRMELPEAEENESWKLENGASYDQNVFRGPKVHAKFFNDRVTFEIDMSITEKQVKESFSSATQLNAFYSMIQTNIENSMTIKLDELIMRTVNNAIAETIHDDYGADALSSKSGVKAVNLLYMYNEANDTNLTAAEAVRDKDFIRFAVLTLSLYVDRLPVISKLFNVGGTEKFTPRDRMHIMLLSEFKRGADTYLQSDTFHDEYTKLPEAESIAYWQGSGTDYAFSSTSNINVKTATGATVNASGILGIIFDRDALGVANLDKRTTTHYNAKAEFRNEFHKADAGYWNDLDENVVVFFVA